MVNKGGRIAPDGRPPQAKGVGKDAKRHDLEAPKTPGLHGTDLQYGDVQALEDGQRIAPATTQQTAAPQGQASGSTGASQAPDSRMEVPDAIDFLADRSRNQAFTASDPRRRIDESRAMSWLPILRQLASGPGASPALVSAFINQARRMQQAGGQPATFVDLRATDDGIEEMLQQGIR